MTNNKDIYKCQYPKISNLQPVKIVSDISSYRTGEKGTKIRGFLNQTV